MLDDGVRVEDLAAGVASIVLDRPPVNAFTTGTYRAVARSLHDLSARADMKVVIIRSGLPRIFCAGADVKQLNEIMSGATPVSDVARQDAARKLFSALKSIPQVSIAEVNGPALGAGCVLTSCCDLRIASSNASLGLPEINVGRCGGGRHLLRHLPQAIVREMYFTGEPLSAQRAYDLGLLNAVAEQADLHDRVLDMASKIAAKSGFALRLAKEALDGCEELTLDAGYAYEQMYTLRLGESPDGREAVQAFMERRPPRWSS